MNFTLEALESSKQALFRLKRFVFNEHGSEGTVNETYRMQFHAAINDDLDTSRAIAGMWELMKDTSVSDADKVATLRNFDTVLDIGLSDAPSDVRRELGIMNDEEVPPEVHALLAARAASREAKNWTEADAIRQEINLKGYTVEDTPQGQRISKN